MSKRRPLLGILMIVVVGCGSATPSASDRTPPDPGAVTAAPTATAPAASASPTASPSPAPTPSRDEVLAALVADLRDRRPSVRLAAAEALGDFGREAVKPLIAALDRHGDALRVAAARSLGRIGDVRATKALVGLLGDSATRRAAVVALVAIHRDDAGPLTRYLRSRATVAVFRPLIRIGQNDTVDPLVTALERFGNTTMAEIYLNCGQPRLEKAARRWARDHGYIVVPGFGAAEEGWGVN